MTTPIRRPRPQQSRSLQEIVEARRRELGSHGELLSYRDLTRRSGDAVSYETWRRILNGTHQGSFSDRVARGIATALELSEAEVYEAAGLPKPETPWVLPARASRLLPKERALIEQHIDLLLGAYERGRQDGQAGR